MFVSVSQMKLTNSKSQTRQSSPVWLMEANPLHDKLLPMSLWCVCSIFTAPGKSSSTIRTSARKAICSFCFTFAFAFFEFGKGRKQRCGLIVCRRRKTIRALERSTPVRNSPQPSGKRPDFLKNNY